MWFSLQRLRLGRRAAQLGRTNQGSSACLLGNPPLTVLAHPWDDRVPSEAPAQACWGLEWDILSWRMAHKAGSTGVRGRPLMRGHSPEGQPGGGEEAGGPALGEVWMLPRPPAQVLSG